MGRADARQVGARRVGGSRTRRVALVALLACVAMAFALLGLAGCSLGAKSRGPFPTTSPTAETESSSSASGVSTGASSAGATSEDASSESGSSSSRSTGALEVSDRSEPKATESAGAIASDEGAGSQASTSDAQGSQLAQAVVDIRSLPAESPVTFEQVSQYGEDACFTVEEIDDATFERMYGLSFKEYCTVPRDDLRYIRVLHVTAEGETHVGELVMNAQVAQVVCDIFHELYRAGYPIHKMRLVDDYGADDDASMEDDNTSAFNYRLVAGTDRMSNHAYGLAIDVNPYYNPYCIPSQDYVSPTSAYQYGQRGAGTWPYKIEEGDLCHRLFLEAGFTWGGYWDVTKDYQHFEMPAA